MKGRKKGIGKWAEEMWRIGRRVDENIKDRKKGRENEKGKKIE